MSFPKRRFFFELKIFRIYYVNMSSNFIESTSFPQLDGNDPSIHLKRKTSWEEKKSLFSLSTTWIHLLFFYERWFLNKCAYSNAFDKSFLIK